jgi:hypothetical protein
MKSGAHDCLEKDRAKREELLRVMSRAILNGPNGCDKPRRVYESFINLCFAKTPSGLYFQ